MANHHDLLDAIARVRAATGDRDAWQDSLTGADIATACSAFSSPDDLGTVLAKIIAAHPDAFLARSPAAPPIVNQGLAADAIRDAEAALAQQNSTSAQLDLQVITAVLNAHAANTDGAAELDRLQGEIETAVLTRPDLDTPSGARQFQQFLTGKLRDIRTVVDTAGLDSTSKAALAAALASLYASATPQHPGGPPGEQPPQTTDSAPAQRLPVRSVPAPDVQEPAETHRGCGAPGLGEPPPLDWESLDWGPAGLPSAMPPPQPAPAPAPAAAMPATPAMPVSSPVSSPASSPVPAMAPPSNTGWGGGLPLPGMGSLATAPALPDLGPSSSDGGGAHRRRPPDTTDLPPEDPPFDRPAEAAVDTAPAPEDPTLVHLPDGQTVNAPSPELAAAITAALGGTPIPEAFGQQGITLPAPGAAVAAAVDSAALLPGDVAVLPDRYAVAVGNGKALLDSQIQPIANVTGPGFLGWQHPPVPTPATDPDNPPERPAATAPS